MDQNSVTPLGEQNWLTPQGSNNMNFRLALEAAANCEPAGVKQTICSQFFLVLS